MHLRAVITRAFQAIDSCIVIECMYCDLRNRLELYISTLKPGILGTHSYKFGGVLFIYKHQKF